MGTIIIRGGILIDGTGGKPVPNTCIVLKEDRVHAIDSDPGFERTGADIELDASGRFILPGFIDCHVHFCFDNIHKTFIEPFSYQFYKVIEPMRSTLDAGVTTVRDGGGTDLGMKRAVENGLIAAPRIQICVNQLYITGGNSDPWQPSGIEVPIFPLRPGFPDGRCDGADEVRKKTREMLRAGADVIKVLATSGIVGPGASAMATHFSPEELAVMVQEAGCAGKTVMAHAHTAQGARNAVEAGIQSVEHGIWLHQDPQCIDLLAEKGTFLVPTLNVSFFLDKVAASGNSDIIPKQAIPKIKGAMENHRKSIAAAYKAGVKIAMGTDAGGPMHGQNLRELQLMCDIGMTPMEAIIAGTRTASECLRMQDMIGTIEVGKMADIVISGVDPIKEIGALADSKNIRVVIKDGKIVKNLF
jgi:imidazolonepropionase-like amidohydrolase